MIHRLTLILLLCFGSGDAFATTRLLLVGGGSRPDSALRRFVEWSGGADSRILIIAWPSTVPGEYVKSLTAEWTALGVSRFLVSETAPVSPGQKREFLAMLEHATGVFFTGGDQNRAMAAVESLALRSVLKDRFDSGVPFGGTSAGTALMAATMITGKNAPETAPGLGLFERGLIDMHFLKRSREPRLLSAMENAGVHFGIGVDEDGAVVIEDSIRAEVLGTPHVVFYDSSSGQVRRFELGDRDRFDLRTWTP